MIRRRKKTPPEPEPTAVLALLTASAQVYALADRVIEVARELEEEAKRERGDRGTRPGA